MGLPPHLVRWMAAFLLDRDHRVRCAKDFLVHINDLTTPCPTYKYVDDRTIFEVCAPGSQSRLQEAAGVALTWSQQNDIIINASKTHELLINFSRNGEQARIPRITMNGVQIERTDSAKILGIIISEDLTWNAHVNSTVSKASKRLYMLYQLKRAGVDQHDLVRIYMSVIRPVLEYAAPVWSSSMPGYLSDKIETIQKRAMRTIFPGMDYDDILASLNVQTLADRRHDMCELLEQNEKSLAQTSSLMSGMCHTCSGPELSTHWSDLELTYIWIP